MQFNKYKMQAVADHINDYQDLLSRLEEKSKILRAAAKTKDQLAGADLFDVHRQAARAFTNRLVTLLHDAQESDDLKQVYEHSCEVCKTCQNDTSKEAFEKDADKFIQEALTEVSKKLSEIYPDYEGHIIVEKQTLQKDINNILRGDGLFGKEDKH